MKKILIILLLSPLLMLSQSDAEFKTITNKFERKNWQEAINELNKIIDSYPNTKEAYYSFYLRGYAYNELENTYNAIKDLKKSLELNPNYEFSKISLYTAYFNSEDYYNAIELLKKIIIIQDKPIYHYDLARAYFKVKDYNNAIRYYSNVINMNSDKKLVSQSKWNRGVAQNNIEFKSGCNDLTQIADQAYYESIGGNSDLLFFINFDYLYNSYCIEKPLYNQYLKQFKKAVKAAYK